MQWTHGKEKVQSECLTVACVAGHVAAPRETRVVDEHVDAFLALGDLGRKLFATVLRAEVGLELQGRRNKG
jgi:hypothetical protein